MPKYIFFDLDNTLTRSRTPITKPMSRLIKMLAQKSEILIVSGQEFKKFALQLGEPLRGLYFSMGQNGNMCIDKAGNLLWENKLNWREKYEVLNYVTKIHAHNPYAYKNELDLLEDRDSQISYSFVGHSEQVHIKEKFDPDKKLRLAILKRFPFQSKSVEVKIAGTTCFDFYIKGSHKGSNIARLCALKGWPKNDCLYIGDALFKNGNDESVLGVIPTRGVHDPSETEDVVRNLLKETT